jgi:glycosyltransferase involved in cell wall biosynthesis
LNTSRLKVSFFVHDLAANPLARAVPLAQAVSRDVDVEVLGFLFSGDSVYAPYRDAVPYHAVPCRRDVRHTLAAIPALAARATGDLVYACKPLVTSLGPALWASGFGRRRPLVLDVEDDEWVPMGRSTREFVARDVVGGWRHATAWKYTRLLHPFTRCAAAVTVASAALERRYGGIRVLHGPDETVFDPDRADLSPARCRAALGLPASAPVAVFSGTPQPHKGWPVLIAALERPEAARWHLALAGRACAEFSDATARLGARCHVLGAMPYSDQPMLLAAASAVPVPQLDVRYAESQVSAKALDALAMRCPLIASRVGDFPAILDGEGERRGWLIQSGDPIALAKTFEAIESQPEERDRRAAAGRRWFLREASASATRTRLLDLFTKTLRTRQSATVPITARH